MGLPAPKTGQMTKQEENLQALRVLDTAIELLQTAELRARLQGEAEREYSVLQSASGGEATQCQTGTEWEDIITDALLEAEFEGEEARIDAWLERNQQSWLQMTYDVKDSWKVTSLGCPYPSKPGDDSGPPTEDVSSTLHSRGTRAKPPDLLPTMVDRWTAKPDHAPALPTIGTCRLLSDALLKRG